MDMPSASMINSNNGVLQQFGIAMLDNQLDIQTQQGANEAAMLASMPAPSPSLESLANPNVGQHIDIGV